VVGFFQMKSDKGRGRGDEDCGCPQSRRCQRRYKIKRLTRADRSIQAKDEANQGEVGVCPLRCSYAYLSHTISQILHFYVTEGYQIIK
jgi:hypothetical protein